jgi:hypothetical protein
MEEFYKDLDKGKKNNDDGCGSDESIQQVNNEYLN